MRVAPLWKHMYVPGYAPTLAFVGLIQKSIRNPQFELQVLPPLTLLLQFRSIWACFGTVRLEPRHCLKTKLFQVLLHWVTERDLPPPQLFTVARTRTHAHLLPDNFIIFSVIKISGQELVGISGGMPL